ncbi:hypothetical protein COS81_02720 [candidate division WWE3 bacterium CG06_land_8_20_14_3_00_42_16]|uniref:Uncharacterized protein n=4 Tax=Katanobacteria TaxID=422282 RepID=A0A2M7AN30_UNCKA|nr:MAG: hypothetical protein COS81_02720 [candidate division WWE3 bacterium CG06_land_8_20_14_3_00_42_16]PIZ42130.1 MAG: hypothetical protein COY34_03380 [candidate division WWE3 bacterium CG_4_10_14_0_2_um_filter_42_8]PJA38050.1 MAG: hypothetical protein CO181_01260 [candidate division WWE3 bacterium CG_4_9_14_3_um_filter_43_9]PJC68732.1 MAG: hypothetical protein CO015_02970 [candidate division WWE3 bacterium CG_4_8_14_3_um_filter_42_11]
MYFSFATFLRLSYLYFYGPRRPSSIFSFLFFASPAKRGPDKLNFENLRISDKIYSSGVV